MHFFIAGDSGGISPAALLEPSWKYDERRIHIWKQDVTFITDKVDVGICTLCLWASSCLTLCTIIIQTYHAVIGSARAGQADLVLRERLWLCKAWTWKSCGILPGWGSRKEGLTCARLLSPLERPVQIKLLLLPTEGWVRRQKVVRNVKTVAFDPWKTHPKVEKVRSSWHPPAFPLLFTFSLGLH